MSGCHGALRKPLIEAAHPLFTVSKGFSMRRLALLVLVAAVLAGLIGAVPVSGALAADAPVVALGFQSTGWAYDQVAYGGEPGFEAPAFDDSAWAVGQAGFGTTDGTCPWNNMDQVHTAWSPGTDMLLRHEFTLPAGASGVHISGTVDNNADVYVNGTPVQHVESGFCNADGINADVPDADISQSNVLAIRARDLGEAAFIDVQVTYVLSPPVIRAGDFNRVFDASPPPGAGLNEGFCTAGFAVVKGSTRYMLTADHCRYYLNKKGSVVGSATRVDVKGPMPPAVLAGTERLPYATGLDCLEASGPSCLRVPGAVSHNLATDVMAWRPDPGSVTATGELQTRDLNTSTERAFPVLGNGDWQLGQQICQVGSSTHGEKCGSILPKKAFDSGSGLVAWQYPNKSEHLIGGDSGGPVYAYMYNPDGSIKGVSALGINNSFSCNKQETICTNYFVPIATIMRELGVTVLNTQ